METVQTEVARHQMIETAAYYLWQQRGCPFGAPEVDWFMAEQQMHEQTESSIVSVAKAVGSALGSVAGLVESLGGLLHSDQPSSPQ